MDPAVDLHAGDPRVDEMNFVAPLHQPFHEKGDMALSAAHVEMVDHHQHPLRPPGRRGE